MPEIQDIFKKYGDKLTNLPSHVWKVVRAIQTCRTSDLGAHVDTCDECGYVKISYNSCRNRHCPKCLALAKDWYIYCKRPFKTTNSVLVYLGRYTHRVAISNHRILTIHDDMVDFKWRDYKDGSKEKVMTLTAEEFMRRFLLHVLPTGFTKIRHYGFLGSAVKKTKLTLCKRLLGVKVTAHVKLSAVELMKKVTSRDITLCPVCGIGHFIQSSGLSPPIA